MACEPGQFLNPETGQCEGPYIGFNPVTGEYDGGDAVGEDGLLPTRPPLEDGTCELGYILDINGQCAPLGTNTPDHRAKVLLQTEFEKNRDQYLPVAEDLAGWLGGQDTGTIDKARQAGLGAGDMASGAANRDINRYGASQTASQRQQFQTGLAMDKTAGGIGAANNARQGLTDTRLSGMQSFIGMGQGLASQSIGGIASNASQMSDMAVQNGLAQDQAKQATQANQMAMASSALMLMMMI